MIVEILYIGAVPGTIAYLINQITGSFESIAFIEFNKSLSFPKKNIRVTV